MWSHYLIGYVSIGFFHNFYWLVKTKMKDPTQQPQTIMEVLGMTLMFIIGLPFWPLFMLIQLRR